MVEDAIVRVVVHLACMMSGCDVGGVVPLGTEIQPQVWLWDEDEDEELVTKEERIPYIRQEKYGACGYEAEEENYDYGMFVMHEAVAKARAAGGDAAIGKL